MDIINEIHEPPLKSDIDISSISLKVGESAQVADSVSQMVHSTWYHLIIESTLKPIFRCSTFTLCSARNCMFKTIVFDMDMTLCYPQKSFDRIFEDVFETTVESVMPGWCEKVTTDGVCSGEEAVDHCFSDRSSSKRETLFQSFTQQWAESQSLFQGALALPQKLKEKYGCKVGIMTNGPSIFQHAILEHLKLKEAFDFCYASGDEDIGMRKPSEPLIKLLQEKENIDPATALFVGNSIQKDLAPAIQCGWSGLHVTPTNDEDGYVSVASLENAIRNGESLVLNWHNLG